MGNLTNQQRIEQLEHGLEEIAQSFNTRLHTEISQLEEKISMNHAIMEAKNADLEKSMAKMLDSQTRIQDCLNRLVSSSSRTQRGSILGNPPKFL